MPIPLQINTLKDRIYRIRHGYRNHTDFSTLTTTNIQPIREIQEWPSIEIQKDAAHNGRIADQSTRDE